MSPRIPVPVVPPPPDPQRRTNVRKMGAPRTRLLRSLRLPPVHTESDTCVRCGRSLKNSPYPTLCAKCFLEKGRQYRKANRDALARYQREYRARKKQERLRDLGSVLPLHLCRICSRCREPKPLSAFTEKQRYCRACMRAYNRERRERRGRVERVERVENNVAPAPGTALTTE